MNFLTKLEDILKDDKDRINLNGLKEQIENEIKTIDKSSLPSNIIGTLEELPNFLELLWCKIHDKENTKTPEPLPKTLFIDNKLIA